MTGTPDQHIQDDHTQDDIDGLTMPLHEVTFCALDLETSGGSPRTSEIVEIGAVKSRGGETLGTFQTLVRPSTPLPVEIQLLTGIGGHALADAPPLTTTLPAFLEFLGPRSVLVAHNASFDHGFLRAACRELDHDLADHLVVDTAKLARRVLSDDVRNVRLATLAAFFRTAHTPRHRAFPDAAACLEVLWGLLERSAAYGVATLGDLLEFQRMRSNPYADKVRLARDLPRARGVYVFRDARGRAIYVGKAADLRSRVRSYFTSDERKRMGDLRRAAASVETVRSSSDLEASAIEARLIERLRPRYNRRGVRRRSPAYLRLTDEPHPRFSVVRRLPTDAAVAVGPFPSHRRAREAGAALAGLFGVRTCTQRLGPRTTVEPCPLYDLGSCHGPCTGRRRDTDAHGRAVRRLAQDLDAGLPIARDRLEAKLARLALRRRFEEATAHRDAFEDLVRALGRADRLRAISAAGRIRLEGPGGRIDLAAGRLSSSGPLVDGEADLLRHLREPSPPRDGPGPHTLDHEGLGERDAVASALEREPGWRIVSTQRPFARRWPAAEAPGRIPLGEP